MKLPRAPWRRIVSIVGVLLVFFSPAGAATDICPDDFSALNPEHKLEGEALDARIQDLARFELEEIQKQDQPSSTRQGLKEDHSKKLALVAKLSGLPEKTIVARIRSAKQDLLFSPRSPSKHDKGLRAEAKQLPSIPPRFAFAKTLRGGGSNITAVVSSIDGKQVASGNERGEIQIWNAQTGELQHTLRDHVQTISSIVFSPDGRRLVSSSNDGTVKQWDTTTWKLTSTRAGEKWDSLLSKNLPALRSVKSLAISPDGSWIAAGGVDGTRVWKTNDDWTGEWDDLISPMHSVAFSPDNKTLMAGMYNGAVWSWDLQSGKRGDQTLLGHKAAVKTMSFSPNGKLLVTSTGSHSEPDAKVWNMRRATELFTLESTPRPIRSPVNSAQFSPDGRWIAAGERRNLRFWDATTGAEVGSFEISDVVELFAFSPDGNTIVSAYHGSKDLTIWKNTRPE